jgi:hypothetical protein
VISEELRRRVACPTCLEARGCPRCLRPEAGPQDYALRVACACGGPDKVALELAADTLVCPRLSDRVPVRHRRRLHRPAAAQRRR